MGGSVSVELAKSLKISAKKRHAIGTIFKMMLPIPCQFALNVDKLTVQFDGQNHLVLAQAELRKKRVRYEKNSSAIDDDYDRDGVANSYQLSR